MDTRLLICNIDLYGATILEGNNIDFDYSAQLSLGPTENEIRGGKVTSKIG